MAPLVSVVVATYRSGPGMDRLVASLDAQSLAPGDLELVAVDDGSGDGTVDRLRAMAASRPWMTVSEVPHSGWPCAPRNAGLELATGDYVLFADHDDVLYPESLERAYRFARDNDADLLNGKEVRTQQWYWAWGTWEQDVPLHPLGDVRGILPMTPHKLYRRQFLLDHGIRFIEGRRVLWEDVYFNIDAMAHRPRVATLSSYPVYHWVATGSNSSTSFGRDQDEQWGNIRNLLTHVHQSGLDAPSKEWLLAHWYRTRVLSWMGPRCSPASPRPWSGGCPWWSGSWPTCCPRRWTCSSDRVDLARAQLLRAHRIDLLHQLAEADRGVTVTPRVVSTWWEGPARPSASRAGWQRSGSAGAAPRRRPAAAPAAPGGRGGTVPGRAGRHPLGGPDRGGVRPRPGLAGAVVTAHGRDRARRRRRPRVGDPSGDRHGDPRPGPRAVRPPAGRADVGLRRPHRARWPLAEPHAPVRGHGRPPLGRRRPGAGVLRQRQGAAQPRRRGQPARPGRRRAPRAAAAGRRPGRRGAPGPRGHRGRRRRPPPPRRGSP